jgi:hypothetical protein
LRTTSRHNPIGGDSTNVSDAHSSFSEVGDDQSQSAGWDVEFREDSDSLVVRHPVKSLAEVNSATKDSRRVIGIVVEVLEDDINHAYNIVDY